MRFSRLAFAGAALAAMFVAGAALADIKAFNAAVKAGDHKAASAEAKEIWKTWDKTKPDTALMAREFGFTSYMAGDYVAARDFGQFLKDQGAGLATPDDQPATSRVLLAAANFRLGANDGTRRELLEALKSREAAKGIDYTTVLAAEALYKHDWSKGAWKDAGETAEVAWRLLDRAGVQLTVRALDARATHAAAGFLLQPDKTDYDKIVDAHNAVVAQMNAATDQKKRLAFAPLKFQLQAWASTVQSYFRSGQQTGTSIPVRVKERELATLDAPIFPDSVRTGGQCENATPVWPTLNYPQAAGFKGAVGTVIMKYDLDLNGKVSGWETLAAVPSQHFGEVVEDAMDELAFLRGNGDPANCDLSATSKTIVFTFRMG